MTAGLLLAAAALLLAFGALMVAIDAALSVTSPSSARPVATRPRCGGSPLTPKRTRTP
jgi:hypothetical protein